MGLLAQFFRHKDASANEGADGIGLGAIATAAGMKTAQGIPTDVPAKPIAGTAEDPVLILAPRVMRLVPGAPPPIFLTPAGVKPPVLPTADDAV